MQRLLCSMSPDWVDQGIDCPGRFSWEKLFFYFCLSGGLVSRGRWIPVDNHSPHHGACREGHGGLVEFWQDQHDEWSTSSPTSSAAPDSIPVALFLACGWLWPASQMCSPLPLPHRAQNVPLPFLVGRNTGGAGLGPWTP
jgi:hypothetical protein